MKLLFGALQDSKFGGIFSDFGISSIILVFRPGQCWGKKKNNNFFEPFLSFVFFGSQIIFFFFFFFFKIGLHAYTYTQQDTFDLLQKDINYCPYRSQFPLFACLWRNTAKRHHISCFCCGWLENKETRFFRLVVVLGLDLINILNPLLTTFVEILILGAGRRVRLCLHLKYFVAKYIF